MSWIAECDTHGKEFPTCVHVTKTTGTIMHGATYVPIEDGGAVRAEKAALERRIDELCAEVEQGKTENAKLRKLVDGITFCSTTSSRSDDCIGCPLLDQSAHNYRCTKTECMGELEI